MLGDRRFYGYRLRSDLALTGLPALRADGTPDIVLRRGAVPAALEAAVWTSPFIDIGNDRTVLIRAGDRLRFRVRGGDEIVLDAPPGSSIGEIETFLLSAVAGALIHQRRELALHASSVTFDGRAVALVGPSGRGKSTLAAALAAQGHAFVADDLCLVRFSDDRAMVTPGASRVRLWPDALEAVGTTADTLPGRPHHPKRLLEQPQSVAQPVPLGLVIRLAVDSRCGAARVERLSGPAAVMPSDELVYRVLMGRRLGCSLDLFRALTRLGALVPVFRLTRPGPTDLSRLVDLVTAAVAMSA